MKQLQQIDEILKQHKGELKRRYKVKEIGIFGSFVRGEQNRRSDLDVLVEFYETPDLLKFINLERYIEKLIGMKVDLVRKQAVRSELRDAILKEVVYL